MKKPNILLTSVLILGLTQLSCQFVARMIEGQSSPSPVPVVAPEQPPASTEPPALPPAEVGAPDEIYLKADGSGDYASLSLAVEAVSLGGAIWLDSGTYPQPEPLEINKSISIIGAGIGETIIVGNSGPAVILFQGPGDLQLTGITVRYQGVERAHVTRIIDGRVNISMSEFTGGVFDSEENFGGTGLILVGNSTGTVTNSLFVGNQLHGLSLHDQAEVTIQANEATQNGESGYTLWDQSVGNVIGCKCSNNTLHGVSVNEQAFLTMENSECRENVQVGLRFSGSAAGTVKNNVFSENGLHGVSINDDADPLLENNDSSNNLEVGLRFSDNAKGTIRNNTFSGNGLHGVSINDGADPLLEFNDCSNNIEIGMRFSGSANGVARGNTCNYNGMNGITVRENASPILESNTTNYNAEAGISYFGNAAGGVSNNECAYNKWGLYLSENSLPAVGNNNCYGNTSKDIDDRR